MASLSEVEDGVAEAADLLFLPEGLGAAAAAVVVDGGEEEQHRTKRKRGDLDFEEEGK